MKLEDFKLLNDESKNFYREIWQQGEYDRFGIAVEPGDIVVDCGANIGLFSQYAVHKGASRVISFEANPQIFEYLKTNTAQTDKITPIHGFVADRAQDNHYNLQRIFTDFALLQIDFLKIDIEGAEYAFLLTAPDELLSRVRKLAMELHLFSLFKNDCADFLRTFALLEKLSLAGFDLKIRYAHPQTCLWMLHAER